MVKRTQQRPYFFWRYITPPDLRRYFERLQLRPGVREVWSHAMEVWDGE